MQRKHPLTNCEECPLQEKGKFVPPDYNGNEKVDIVYVGEAPGVTEARKGKPFTGMSGKLLDATLKEHGLKRSDAVLTNTVLCRPPGNDTPNALAVACCKPALDDLLENVEPKYVVAMGNTSASLFLERTTKITQDRVGPAKDVGKPYKVIPTVHPAACLRNPNLFPLFNADIGKLNPKAQIVWEPPQYKAYNDQASSIRAIEELLSRTRQETVVLDLEVGEEKDNTFGHPNTLLCAGIAYEAGKAIVIGERPLSNRGVRDKLSILLGEKKVVCHNGKYDLGTLYRMGFKAFNLAKDTMLMAYTLDEVPGTKGLKYLGQEKLGCPDWDSEIKTYTTGAKGSWHNIPKDILYRYNAYDVAVTWDLMELFESEMDEDDHKLHRFLCWASDQLMIMESEGIYIDRVELDRLERDMSNKLIDIKIELQKKVEPLLFDFDERVAGLIRKNGGFNPNSVDQVRATLQLLMGARVTSTDIDTLKLLLRHRKPGVPEFAQEMIEWRKISKLFGTYVKGTKERLTENGRIQTSYLLHGTETGRLSSRNPNVQNVPRESKYANFRSVYAAEPGHRTIYADYGNIEGRIVSVLADDEAMQGVLRDSTRDIHSEIAKLIYGNDFNKEQRVSAKTVVHGKNYARTPDGIAEGLGISISEARKISNAYDAQFPRVKMWHEEIKHQVLNTEEELITPWGRKRRFGLITRDNAEDVFKEALAFKPQAIGSDICLTAGVRLKEAGLPVRILIHDGIVAEVAEEDVDDAKVLMKDIMEEAGREFTEKVPFPVDIAVGANWGEVD